MRAELGMQLLDTCAVPTALPSKTRCLQSQPLLEVGCSAVLPQSDGDFGTGFLSHLPNISQKNRAGNKFYQTGLATGS